MLNPVDEWHYTAHFPCESYDSAWNALATGEPMKMAWRMANEALDYELNRRAFLVKPIELVGVNVIPCMDALTVEIKFEAKIRKG